MNFLEKYRKFLYSGIRVSFPVCVCLALMFSPFVYPAYSRLFLFSLPEKLLSALLIAAAVLSLCRFLVSVDSGEGAERAAGIFMSFAIFSAAYYFRNAGGFAVKGYVFSFAALTAVQSAFPVPEKSADGKNKRLMLSFFVASALLFAAISAFSAYACIFRSAVTASAVMRLCGFPMLILLPAAVYSGMKCGIIGRITYYAARIFSFTVAAFVFATSFAFDSAGTLCTVFSVFYAVFMLLCIADLLKSRR